MCIRDRINAVMIGFGIGINAVISFYLGAQNKKMADRAATQGMLLGTIHGIGFMKMCIRDRIYTSLGLTGGSRIYYAKYVLGDEMLNSTMTMFNYIPTILTIMLIPVFTKRFGKIKALFVGFLFYAAGLVLEIAGPVNPVSYTHLDVYKRQIQFQVRLIRLIWMKTLLCASV